MSETASIDEHGILKWTEQRKKPKNQEWTGIQKKSK